MKERVICDGSLVLGFQFIYGSKECEAKTSNKLYVLIIDNLIPLQWIIKNDT